MQYVKNTRVNKVTIVIHCFFTFSLADLSPLPVCGSCGLNSSIFSDSEFEALPVDEVGIAVVVF